MGFIIFTITQPFKFALKKINNHLLKKYPFEILKREFDEGNQIFSPSSFNYYSSFNYPISHFFADILPIVMYLRPKYKIYKRV